MSEINYAGEYDHLFLEPPRVDVHPINGIEYVCLDGRIDISKVNFWEKNPRVSLELEQKNNFDDISQDIIYDLMVNYDDTISLQESITTQGGIKQHILVAVDPLTNNITAFDGNTRLTIAKKFFKINHKLAKQHIKAIFLIDTRINLEILEYEVANIHLDPTLNDWDSHKKARFYWERVTQFLNDGTAKTPSTAAQTVASRFSTGITKTVVENSYKIVEFMTKYNIGPEEQKSQYGYWEPYITKGVVTKAREFFNDKKNLEGQIKDPKENAFDLMMVDKVRNGKSTGEVTNISAGGDGAWRTEIDHLCKSFTVTKRKDIIFGMLNGDTLQEAVHNARQSGAADVAYSKIRTFKNFLDDPDTTKKLRKLVRTHEDLKTLLRSIEMSAKITYASIRDITSNKRKKRVKKNN